MLSDGFYPYVVGSRSDHLPTLLKSRLGPSIHQDLNLRSLAYVRERAEPEFENFLSGVTAGSETIATGRGRAACDKSVVADFLCRNQGTQSITVRSQAVRS